MKHIIPDRAIKPETLPDYEKTYPNRWMEDRHLRNLHNRVSSLNFTERKTLRRELSVDIGNGKKHQLNMDSRNDKYMQILYEYVLPEHAWKVLKWLNTISEDNKKVSKDFDVLKLRKVACLIFVTYVLTDVFCLGFEVDQINYGSERTKAIQA